MTDDINLISDKLVLSVNLLLNNKLTLSKTVF